MHIELLKLVPAVKNYFWGGKKLAANWNKKSQNPIIAETWEVSLHSDGLSKVESGNYNGKTLKELLDKWGDSATGKSASLFPMFPLLIKLIDTGAMSSIQVHPDDDYAHKNEQQFGKNEAWYILEAEEGAGVYLGFKTKVTKAQVQKSIEEGNLLDMMQFYPVKSGDVFYVPAGTVHCVGAGITFVEIEKNSNVNYRLFDFNRDDAEGKKRELHIQKALDVAILEPYTLKKIEPENKAMRQLVTDRYFTVREIKSTSILKQQIDDSFCAILFLGGEGEITDGLNKYAFKKGDTYFVPAKIPFKITGNTRFLEIFV
jgi:mannose-6-phosphate isomerase